MRKQIALKPESSTDEWIIALAHESAGFAVAKTALAPMIRLVVERVGADWTPLARCRAIATCRRLVAVSAERYLRNFLKTRRQKFSTYYTWYLAQVVNNVNPNDGTLSDEVTQRISARNI